MLRNFKTVIGLMMGVAMVQQAAAFTIWGPAEAWQTTTLSYLTRFWSLGDTEAGAPKNFGEGSRLNVPIITYACDDTFLSYFGNDGAKAVDAAFAALNRLPAASSASPGLTEFITEGNQQINYTAQALSMHDVKSSLMGAVLQYMGLLGDTHVWDLRQRTLLTAPCTYEYVVINRNFDPITWDLSDYVNGTQYGFQIFDGCPAGTQIADAVETFNDTTILPFSTRPVSTLQALQAGGFYLGFTRDDFGGLRYLYNAKSPPVWEAMPPNTYVGSSSSPWTIVSTNATNGGLGWIGAVYGVEKITYVKTPFNSLAAGTNYATNVVHYKLKTVTNSQLQELEVTRSNTAPDIIITAGDLGPGISYTNTVTFIASGSTSPGNGTEPEIMSPTMILTVNKLGPYYVNENPSFLDQSTAVSYPTLQWGSFDGSTNAPIAFPTGTSLAGLEAAVTSGSGTPINVYNPIVSTNTVAAGGAGTGTAGAIIFGQSP